MGPLIFVIDDEPDIEPLFRQQFRKELRAKRFLLAFERSAAGALSHVAALDADAPSLILSDINMPGMSGLDMLPQMRQLKPETPIIMVTAYGDAGTAQEAGTRGAMAVLTKPIDFDALRETILRHLGVEA
jgi:DNA-binding NtrC family response regulator